MERLSSSHLGESNSANVADALPRITIKSIPGDSTDKNKQEPTKKHKLNIAKVPSNDFLPILILPNEIPIMAAVRSPNTKNTKNVEHKDEPKKQT